ncbi:MAG: hypothetical protein KJ064_17165 [Anaerolineae bacterium]|nr:hypothetical protein [Anaerolineae bacterium]
MKQEFILRTFFGLLLLLPGAYLCWTTLAAPALDTLDKSRTNYDPVREDVDDVGSKNFDFLLEDNEIFENTVSYTARLVQTRLVIVAVVPLLVGVVIGLQGRLLRNINRVLLTFIGVFLSPVVFAILAMMFLGRTWDFKTFDPSPLGEIPDSLFLGSVDGAKNVVALTDAILTLGIAVVVGGIAYAAVMRGWQAGYKPGLAFVGVWLLGCLLALASVSHTLILPYLMTNGGPGRATMTLPFMIYSDAFLRFRFGLASAEAAFLIVPTIIIGFLIWVVVTFFRLRLVFVRPATAIKNYDLLSLVSLPMIAALAVPTLGLIVWGFWLVNKNGSMSDGAELLDLDNTFGNTIAAPWTSIWLVQLPVTYLVGFALGYLRPFGRWGGNVLFLPFLLFALMPTEALMMQWFDTAREKGILNSDGALVYPWIIGLFSLLVFKMFFDGAYEKYEAARQEGQPVSQAFIFQVLVPSVGVSLVVGAVLSFLAVQSLLWPLITLNDPDQLTMTVQLVRLRGAFATEWAQIAGATMRFSQFVAVIFLPVFLLLHLGVVDRLAILGGAPEQPAPKEDEVTPDSLGLIVEA